MEISPSQSYSGSREQSKRQLKTQVMLSLTIIALIIVVTGISFVLIYNGMVRAEKDIEEAKAQIETVYQRRLDLIPNLVETVKGYAAHERQTLTDVAEARSKAQGILKEIATEKSLSKEQIAKLTDSQSELTGVLKTFFVSLENYPNLKASTHFLALQDQLEGTENRVAIARLRYNSSVKRYNTKIAIFPGSIIASIYDFEEKDDYFKATEEAGKATKVKF